jgi:hypothetical protein
MKSDLCSADSPVKKRTGSNQTIGLFLALIGGVLHLLNRLGRALPQRRTVSCMAFLAATQGVMCFGQIADLTILHAKWQSDPRVEEPTPVLNTHLSGIYFDITNQGETPATTFRIYWANGPSLANKLSLLQSEIVPSMKGHGWNRDDAWIPASSLIQPVGATHLILVIDEDNLVEESNEENNLLAFSFDVDFTVDSIISQDHGLHYVCRTDFANTMSWAPMRTTSAKLFWAKGPTLQDITSETTISPPLVISGPRWQGEVTEAQVDAAAFQHPPAGTTCVLLALDPDELLVDPNRENNLQTLGIQEIFPGMAGQVESTKGTVTVMRNGVLKTLSKDDLVYIFETIETKEKSFVKIVLLDRSIISLGPQSSMLIESARISGQGASWLTLLKGYIRSQVTKEYLDVEDTFKVHTKTVGIGVRGTDFEVEYEELNGVATTHVSVFEGVVDVTEEATGRMAALNPGETLQILSDVAVPVPSIVGGWFLPDAISGGSQVTFLANGEYLLFRDGDSTTDPGGQDGIERGTYSWDPATGTLAATVLVDTNGEWGFSHSVAVQPATTAAVGETTLELNIPGRATATFSRVQSSASPLVGSWYVVGGTSAGGIATVTFFADGSYYFTQDGDPGKDPTGMDGGERGNYTWDSEYYMISATAVVDTCGNWGLPQLGPSFYVNLANNDNTLIIFTDTLPDALALYRVRPFDGSFIGWNATHALFGAEADPAARHFADNLPNLIRYGLNLDNSPTPPGNLPLSQVVEISGTRYLTLEFRVRKDLHGAALVPHFSTTLNQWSPVSAANIYRLADDDVNTERHVVRLPLTGTSGFLRLSATEPPG